MKKQVVKVEALLTVISPQQTVRIMDDTLSKKGGADVDRMTIFKGSAVKAFREFAGKGAMIKHISPEVEQDADAKRYVMHVYIYQ